MARVVELRPWLRDQQPVTERQRRIPQETIERLDAAGIFSLTKPVRFGGADFTPPPPLNMADNVFPSHDVGMVGWLKQLVDEVTVRVYMDPDKTITRPVAACHFWPNLALVEKVGALASRKGCTPGQLALAWVMGQGEDVVPIPGTKRRKYLEENLGALEVRLGREDLEEIDAVFPRSAVAGARYAAGTVGAKPQDQERRPG